ncbi:MAG TPA: hypothetical protein VFM18_20280 [Methanosarcina sp.]|nr:hypothetical protein [Methanosarcina sp.]
MQEITLRLYKTTDQPLHEPSHVDTVLVPDETTSVEDMAIYIERRSESGTVDMFIFNHPTSGPVSVIREKQGYTYHVMNF